MALFCGAWDLGALGAPTTASASRGRLVPLLKRGAAAWANAQQCPERASARHGTNRLLVHAVQDCRLSQPQSLVLSQRMSLPAHVGAGVGGFGSGHVTMPLW